MKKSIATTTICLLLVLAVWAQKVNDVDAIKAVIERETKAYFGIDYKTWMESWVHSPAAFWSYADSSGITNHEGWKAIEIGFTDYFVTSKPNNSTQIERAWQEVKVYGNGAYARFKQ